MNGQINGEQNGLSHMGYGCSDSLMLMYQVELHMKLYFIFFLKTEMVYAGNWMSLWKELIIQRSQ